jgi:hypothetical protein
MDEIVIIEGLDLAVCLGQLQWIVDLYERDRLRTLRVCIDEGTFKIKANEHTWSPPFGTVEPR